VRRLMEELDINGSFDVYWQGTRSSGWVGKPGGDDHEVVVTIKALAPSVAEA
jgi:hypothetical protein